MLSVRFCVNNTQEKLGCFHVFPELYYVGNDHKIFPITEKIQIFYKHLLLKELWKCLVPVPAVALGLPL